MKRIEEDKVRAGLDWMAVHSLRRGNGSCYWPSSFRLCSLVRPSDCFLVNCIGGATTYFFLAATASLLFYTWAPWPKWCCSSCAKFIASCSSYFPENGSSSWNGGQWGGKRARDPNGGIWWKKDTWQGNRVAHYWLCMFLIHHGEASTILKKSYFLANCQDYLFSNEWRYWLQVRRVAVEVVWILF